jgi:predicted small secreted protein
MLAVGLLRSDSKYLPPALAVQKNGPERHPPPDQRSGPTFFPSDYSVTFLSREDACRAWNPWHRATFLNPHTGSIRSQLKRAKIMRKSAITAIALAALALIAACNTVEGAGEDLQSAGTAVQNAAQ